MGENINNEISFKEIITKIHELLRYLRTKWIWILFISLVGGSLGLANAYLNKPTYTAVLSFALEDDKGSSSGALGLASQLGFDLGTGSSGAFTGSNIIELMKSRLLVEKTLLNTVKIGSKKSSLVDYYIDFNGWRDNWENNSELKSITFKDNSRASFTRNQDSILGIIYTNLIHSNLFVEQKDKKVSIITIEVVSGNETFAKLFTENLAEEVTNFYIETKTKKTAQNVDILEWQTDSIRKELNAAILGVASFNDNIYNLNPSASLKRTPTQKRQIDVQVNSAVLTEMVKNLELAKMTLRKEKPLIQIIDRPIFPLKKDKLSKKNGLIQGIMLGAILGIAFFLGVLLWKNLRAKL